MGPSLRSGRQLWEGSKHNGTRYGLPSVPKAKWIFQKLLRRDGVQPGVQSGLVTGGSVLVYDALLDRFVEGRNGLPEALLGRLLIAFGESFAQAAESAPQA